MQKIVILVLAVSLSACSFIMPRPHDPVMFGNLVDVKIQLDKTNCDNKDWNALSNQVERLSVYASLRDDPQAEAAKQLMVALDKANKSTNKTFCQSILKVQKTRIDVIVNAWSGR